MSIYTTSDQVIHEKTDTRKDKDLELMNQSTCDESATDAKAVKAPS